MTAFLWNGDSDTDWPGNRTELGNGPEVGGLGGIEARNGEKGTRTVIIYCSISVAKLNTLCFSHNPVGQELLSPLYRMQSRLSKVKSFTPGLLLVRAELSSKPKSV